jgi:hypothetical protein
MFKEMGENDISLVQTVLEKILSNLREIETPKAYQE